MRISNQPDEPEEELPLEVQLWLNKGWTIIRTERRGIVLSGQKSMKGRSKILLTVGVFFLAFVFLPLPKKLAWVGVGLVALSILDFKYATKPPTKFFPADGERTRTLER